MSTIDLPKAYDPQEAQRRWYAYWQEQGYFHAPDSPRKPYCIVIPPPNVTGALHLGHALNNTLQDILIRWKRMQGFDALWMPGTDHAGIATQAVVEKRLFEEEKKTRHDIGREDLVSRIWAWKDEYEARILGQLRQMGCSCDWERTRFTLDAVCSKAVRRTFFNLFSAGKIFRGKRLVNWDTQLRTAVADDEIYTEEIQGKLWHIRYPVIGSEESLVVATTRPETMLGDTAVAVHPDDNRYRHLIGSSVLLPLLDRAIPIIADPILVDRELGTGCVKVTPAHDPNDYQCGVRNHLPMINLLNPDGTYNENAGPYAGLRIMQVRNRVLADLVARGLLLKTEDRLVPMKYSDRSKTPIEPFLSDQWFVRMADDEDGAAGFAQQAMDAVATGRVKVHPERYAKSYLDWLGEKRDWCISRQLWWGHRIPVWSLPEGDSLSREQFESLLSRVRELCREYPNQVALANFSRDPEESDASHSAFRVCLGPDSDRFAQELESLGLVQDPDVLDTWFSSALWPHSTLGWPEKSPELAGYYPTSVLSTARDIITLWVARMVIFGLFNMKDIPFKDVFIHPVIQDGHGKRMSKSAGNGVDPADIIDMYGADALRYTLAALATETQDLRIPVEKAKLPDGREVNTSERFEQGRNFANKFWNAARLVLMNLEGYEPAAIDWETLPTEDKWVLSSLDNAARGVTAQLEQFHFAEAARLLRDFTWNDFCDWYLEFVKGRLRDPAARPLAQRVLAAVLDGLCRLLHPMMPFVTEQVWQALGQLAPRRGFSSKPSDAEASVCIAAWPKEHRALAEWDETPTRLAVDSWREKITAIRNLRAERNVPAAARINPVIVAEGLAADRLRQGEAFLRGLTGSDSVTIAAAADRPAESAVTVLSDAEVILPLAGLIDKQAERAKLQKTHGDLLKQIGPIQAKLNNEGFVSRAPAEVVAQQRARLAELQTQLTAIEALLEG